MKAFLLIIIIFIGTVTEVLGIGLLVPLISIILNENATQSHWPLGTLLVFIQGESHAETVKHSLYALIMAFVFKSAYLTFMYSKQGTFVFGLKRYISTTLFHCYLFSRYEDSLQRNSGFAIRNITTEADQFTRYILEPTIFLITEIAVLLGVFGLLLFFQPVGATVMFAVLLTGGGGFFIATQGILASWGRGRQAYEGKRIQRAQEGLNGLKQIKAINKEPFFFNLYQRFTIEVTRFEKYQSVLSQMPRLWLELIGVFSLALLINLTIADSQRPQDAVPIIALFAAAAFRLLPSANRILSSFQSIKYGSPSLELICDELGHDHASKTNTGLLKFTRNICLEDLTYVYPSSGKPVFENICLTVKKGEYIGIVGPSGTGKSTLVDVFLGLLKPTHGRVLVDGLCIQDDLQSWQEMVSYVTQEIFLTDDTIERNIAFGVDEKDIDRERVKDAVQKAQLGEFLATLPDGLDCQIGERGVRLSGGQRQRIGIARAIYRNTAVIVFDEATSALDRTTEAEIINAVASLKGEHTMLVISHRLETLSNCDRIIEIKGGGAAEVKQN